MRVVPLTDSKIKAFKPRGKPYKVADGGGLYLHMSVAGSKIWKVRYKFRDKTTTISLGKYPVVSLKDARVLRIDVFKKIENGINPKNKVSKNKELATFEKLCSKYFTHRSDLGKEYVKDSKALLANHFYGVMGEIELNNIEAIQIIECIEFMNKKGLSEAIRKAGSMLDRIFKFGTTMQMIQYNPMRDIDMSILIRPYKKKNFVHITDEKEFKELLLDIEEYYGNFITKTALRFMPYVFVRPQNIRAAEWVEFDFDNKLWSIPKEKMKTQRDHIVPLTDSMINILDEMRGNGSKWVFPSPQSPFRMMSENTLNMGLKRLGYKDKMTSHGFRHTASTMLNEYSHIHGIGRDMIEVQMAHTIGGVEGVYNKATYLTKRRSLMQFWSDFLDDLKA